MEEMNHNINVNSSKWADVNESTLKNKINFQNTQIEFELLQT